MNNLNELTKLNKIDEDLDSSQNTPLYNMTIDGSSFKGVELTPYFDLVIPEGVTELSGSIDWKLYASLSGWWISCVKKIIMPSSLTRISRILFWTKPQYDITIEFKGSITQLIKREEDIERITSIKSKAKKEEYIKRALCSLLNVSYTKTTFIFDVPLDLEVFSGTEIEL